MLERYDESGDDEMLSVNDRPLALPYFAHAYPVRGLVHAGAGTIATVRGYASSLACPVILIEADEQRAQELKTAATDHGHITVVQALLSERPAPLEFYLASNPNESGVVSAEALTFVWRNLATESVKVFDGIPLDILISEKAGSSNDFNWLVVDCLPALPILAGADALLQALDVVVARVIRSESAPDDLAGTQEQIESFLFARGFQSKGLIDEHNPAIVSEVFCRDWKQEAHRVTEELRELAAQSAAADTKRRQEFEELLVTERHRASEQQRELQAAADEQLRHANQAAELERSHLTAGFQASLEEARSELSATREALEQNRRDGAAALAQKQVEVQALERAIAEATNELRLLHDSHRAEVATIARAAAEAQEQREAAWQASEMQMQARHHAAIGQLESVIEQQRLQISQCESAIAERMYELTAVKRTLVAQAEGTVAIEAKLADARSRHAQALEAWQANALAMEETHAREAAVLREACSNAEQHVRDASKTSGERENQLLMELEQGRASLEAERAAHARERGEWLVSTDQIKNELDERSSELSRMQACLDGELNKSAQLSAALLELQNAKTQAVARADALVLECQGLRAQVEEANRAVRLANKLAVLRHSEVEDLRERYRQVVVAQDRQRGLMLQLEEKLLLASRYFGELTVDDGKAVPEPAAPRLRRKSAPPTAAAVATGHIARKGKR